MAARQHEFIGKGMLGTPVVVTESAETRTGQVGAYVVGRIGKRSAEMAGLRVVAEQYHGHAGHETHFVETLQQIVAVARFNASRRRRKQICAHTCGHTYAVIPPRARRPSA